MKLHILSSSPDIRSPGWYTFPDASQDFVQEYATFICLLPKQSGSILPNRLSSNWLLKTPVREYLRKTAEAEAREYNRYGDRFLPILHRIAQHKKRTGLAAAATGMGRRAVPVMLGDSLRALFIGNSYTQYNRLVRQVQALAASTGHKLSIKLVEHGGWTLKKHAANPETLMPIREGKSSSSRPK